MKKLLSLLLAAMMLFAMSATVSAEEGNYKIAIMTGTTTQNEEEYRAAQRAYEADPEHIITDTYPESFMAEQETTVSKLVAFASNPDVKAIIMCQAVPGAKAAFDKIREMGRDDILLIAGVAQEDPAVIAPAADIILYADEARQGDTAMETLANWGVDVFIHYSFPRHMAMELIVARHDALEANADALGIEFYDVTAPDPTAEAGVTASQQFILEDVPQQMEKFAGKKVAFFTTNCSMQEPLQQALLTQPDAYYPLPCCPSPYHGFPSVLGLSTELTEAADDEATLRAIAEKLAEYDAVGRFSTWPAPINMAFIDIGVAYANEYIAGTITERNDSAALSRLFDEKLGGAVVNLYEDADGNTFDNYYLILLASVDFNEYR